MRRETPKHANGCAVYRAMLGYERGKKQGWRLCGAAGQVSGFGGYILGEFVGFLQGFAGADQNLD